MAQKRSLLPQRPYFRCGKVHYIWHWIIAFVETSREIIIKYDLLLNIHLASNLGKFRVIRLWVWPSKVSFTTVVLVESLIYDSRPARKSHLRQSSCSKISFTTVVLLEIEFQRRFWNIFYFTLSFFQALLKRWVNNKLKLNESSLLHIFYYIL